MSGVLFPAVIYIRDAALKEMSFWNKLAFLIIQLERWKPLMPHDIQSGEK